jgi:hypothetical protein
MKHKTLTLLVFSVALCGSCQNAAVSDVDNNFVQNTSFSTFVQSIPLLPPEFNLNSNDEIQHVDLNSKFIPERAALVGKLPSIGNYQFIVYSYSGKIERPILEVYNADGIKINQQELFIVGWCPANIPEYYNATLSEDGTKFYLETLCVDDHTEGFNDTIVLRGLILTEK